MRFQVISDIHISLPKKVLAGRLQAVLDEIAQLCPGTAGVICVGDAADYGMPWEYGLIKRAIRNSAIDADKVLFALGNHEHRLPPFRADLHRWQRFAGHTAPYWCVETAEADFIALGCDEKPTRWDGTRLSASQLDWLDDRLSAAEATQRHAFVFNHEPLFDTVDGSFPHQVSGRSIDNDDDLRSVLFAHPACTVFSAHSHRPCNAVQVEGGPVFANTGAIGFDESYGRDFCQGWFVEADEDGVLLHAYDFLNHDWLSTFKMESR